MKCPRVSGAWYASLAVKIKSNTAPMLPEMRNQACGGIKPGIIMYKY